MIASHNTHNTCKWSLLIMTINLNCRRMLITCATPTKTFSDVLMLAARCDECVGVYQTPKNFMVENLTKSWCVVGAGHEASQVNYSRLHRYQSFHVNIRIRNKYWMCALPPPRRLLALPSFGRCHLFYCNSHLSSSLSQSLNPSVTPTFAWMMTVSIVYSNYGGGKTSQFFCLSIKIELRANQHCARVT